MPKTGEKALVALPDDRQAGIITVTLSRAGYDVETLDDWEEATRLLDRAAYDIVVTTHAASAKGGYSPYQKIVRMPAETRRTLCLIVVADDVTTGDAAAAYKLQADLAVRSDDLHDAGMEFREVVFDRKRVYQAYMDALKRLEEV
jgi:CheY-like chemotaxis protein